MRKLLDETRCSASCRKVMFFSQSKHPLQGKILIKVEIFDLDVTMTGQIVTMTGQIVMVK